MPGEREGSGIRPRLSMSIRQVEAFKAHSHFILAICLPTEKNNFILWLLVALARRWYWKTNILISESGAIFSDQRHDRKLVFAEVPWIWGLWLNTCKGQWVTNGLDLFPVYIIVWITFDFCISAKSFKSSMVGRCGAVLYNSDANICFIRICITPLCTS